MATKSETERLTRVEDNQADMAKDITEMKQDIKNILSSLDSLSGGKKALIWAIATAISIAAIVIGLLNLFRR